MENSILSMETVLDKPKKDIQILKTDYNKGEVIKCNY